MHKLRLSVKFNMEACPEAAVRVPLAAVLRDP